MHWTRVLVLYECWVRIPAWPVAPLVSLSKTLNHNCFVLRIAVGPVCCVMHVKEPRTLNVKEKGLAPVFLVSRLEHPAGWICAHYKSSVLVLLLLLLIHLPDCGYYWLCSYIAVKRRDIFQNSFITHRGWFSFGSRGIRIPLTSHSKQNCEIELHSLSV